MTSEHLLPANATVLEQAVSLAIDPLPKLVAPADAIRRFKTDPADALLPWLIWEYGLGELLPYLPEPRRAIAEGIRWQRLRGTPAALTTALSWIDITAAIEEEEPTPAHWAEFQLNPGRVLLDAEIDPILAVARLSAPARSRLARIYHGHDIRHLRLDRSRLDDALLSDYSGSRWIDGVTRLSFGRRFDTAAGVVPAAWMARLATHLYYAHYADRCLLSVMALSGCVPVPNPRFEHSHWFELIQRNRLNHRFPIAPWRKYCKAQVVPSEQWPIGSTNACLPAREWVPGEPFRLGDGLSQVTGGHWREILERFERLSVADADGPEVVWRRAAHMLRTADLFARRVLRLGEGRLDERGSFDVFGVEHTATDVAVRPEIIVSVRPERRFARAEIVLSEQWDLGDTNACLSAREWIAGETLYLSQDDLSQVRGGRYASITERIERLIATPDPIVVPSSDVLPADGHERSSSAAAAYADRCLLSTLTLSECQPLVAPVTTVVIDHTSTAHYVGQHWAGPWADVAWSAVNTLITTHHTQES